MTRDPTQSLANARRRVFAFLVTNSRVVVRTILCLVGLWVLLLGVSAASRSDAATPLLLAGVTLGVLAVFGDRITDVTFSWQEKKVSARLQPIKEDVDRVAAEAPEGALKEQLHEISNKVSEIQAAAATSNRTERPSPYTATHLVGGSGDVLLQLRGPGPSPIVRVGATRCVVTDPSGATLTAERQMEPKLGFSGSMWSEVSFRWPDDFPSDGISSGKHVVDWFIRDYLSATSWSNALGRRVAIDAFKI